MNKLTTGIRPENLNTSVQPQNDFYEFACGGWAKSHPLTPTFGCYTVDEVAYRESEQQLTDMLEQIVAQQHPQGSNEQKMVEIYKLLLEKERQEAEGKPNVDYRIRALRGIDDHLGWMVAQAYVEKFASAETKMRALNIVNNIRQAYREKIDALTWANAETQAKMHKKLDTLKFQIGYPDTWIDYSGLEIDPTASLDANYERIREFERQYCLAQTDTTDTPDKWEVLPHSIVSKKFYNKEKHTICIPAAYLRYPFFDVNADDTYNYGALGTLIAHEITKAIVDELYPRAKDIEEHFNTIEIELGVFAEGKWTLCENICDLAGLEVALRAMQTNSKNITPQEANESYTPAQRFFLAYAMLWAGNFIPKYFVYRLKAKRPSFGSFRINGILPLFDAWYEAWSVIEDSPLYLAPEQRVTIL